MAGFAPTASIISTCVDNCCGTRMALACSLLCDCSNPAMTCQVVSSVNAAGQRGGFPIDIVHGGAPSAAVAGQGVQKDSDHKHTARYTMDTSIAMTVEMARAWSVELRSFLNEHTSY
mgnify:CR=1 FL=1